jgi:hypothetical protein
MSSLDITMTEPVVIAIPDATPMRYLVYDVKSFSPIVRGNLNTTLCTYIPVVVAICDTLEVAKKRCDEINDGAKASDKTVWAYVRESPISNELISEHQLKVVYPPELRRWNTNERCVSCNRAYACFSDDGTVRCKMTTCDLCRQTTCDRCLASVSLTHDDKEWLMEDYQMTKKEVRHVEEACQWCASFRSTCNDE